MTSYLKIATVEESATLPSCLSRGAADRLINVQLISNPAEWLLSEVGWTEFVRLDPTVAWGWTPYLPC
jgi:hypothetical protein